MSRHDPDRCTAEVCQACAAAFRAEELLAEAGPRVPEQRRRQLREDLTTTRRAA